MKSMSLSHIGKAIRMARKKQNMTQGDLAKAIGVSTPTIVKLEQGEDSITFSKMEKALIFLNLIDDFRENTLDFRNRVEQKLSLEQQSSEKEDSKK